jgi:hypothetical protein
LIRQFSRRFWLCDSSCGGPLDNSKKHFYVGGIGEDLTMALGRGRPLEYDVNRLSFRFTMFDGDREIACSISSAALDDFEGKRGTQPSGREGQFLQYREEIERVAARVYDAAYKGKDRISVIGLYAKHFKKIE